MAANSFNDTVVTAVRNAGVDLDGNPNAYAQEAASWLGVPVSQIFDVQRQYQTEEGFDVAGLTAALQAMAPADTMQNVAQSVDTLGQVKDRQQQESGWDQGPLGGFGTALMGTAIVVGAGALGGAFSGAAAGGEAVGAIDAVGGAGTGVGEAVGAGEVIAGTESSAGLIGGAATDTVATTGGGLIDSLGANLAKTFEPWNLIERGAVNALSQAVMNDGKVDWSKVGVSTLLNAFGGALGRTAGSAVSAATDSGLIGSIAGGAVSGVTQAAILGGKDMLATAIASGITSGVGSVTQDWLNDNAKGIATKIFGDKFTAEHLGDIKKAIQGGITAATAAVAGGSRDAESIFTSALMGTGMGYFDSDIKELFNGLTGEERAGLDQAVGEVQEEVVDTSDYQASGGGPFTMKDILDMLKAGDVEGANRALKERIGGFGDALGPDAEQVVVDYTEPGDPGGSMSAGDGGVVVDDGLIDSAVVEPGDPGGSMSAGDGDNEVVDPSDPGGSMSAGDGDNAVVEPGDPGGSMSAGSGDNAVVEPVDPGGSMSAGDGTDVVDEPVDTGEETTDEPTTTVNTPVVVTPVIVPEEPTLAPTSPPPTAPPAPPPVVNSSGELSFSDIALGFRPIAGRTAEYWKTQRI